MKEILPLLKNSIQLQPLAASFEGVTVSVATIPYSGLSMVDTTCFAVFVVSVVVGGEEEAY